MTDDPGPHELAGTFAILDSKSAITTKPVGPGFYEAIDTEFDGFRGCALIAEHSFSEAWESWEMHPRGDELVYLIEGDVEFVLWHNGAEQLMRIDASGMYVVVPRGVWHTARPRKPSRMLFVTPGEGTEHAAIPPAG